MSQSHHGTVRSAALRTPGDATVLGPHVIVGYPVRAMGPELSIIQIVMVLVIALLVFGPSRLPELGRQIGKGLRELRRHAGAVSEDLGRALEDDDRPSAPTVPAAGPSDVASDDELLDGVVIGSSASPPKDEEPSHQAPEDDVLDGVVVPGDRPPTPPGKS